MDSDPLARLGVTHDQIRAFCEKWQIVRFELFGSVLRDDFDAESDVDVLVTYGSGVVRSIGSHLDQEDALADLFGRRVDLIERKLMESSENWIRRKAILDSARLLYAAA
jgi:predicted nucleotidyltransferase